MTREQAVAELARIQDILPQIASALAEERKPTVRYARTSFSASGNDDGFMNIPDGIDEELPFN